MGNTDAILQYRLLKTFIVSSGNEICTSDVYSLYESQATCDNKSTASGLGRLISVLFPTVSRKQRRGPNGKRYIYQNLVKRLATSFDELHTRDQIFDFCKDQGYFVSSCDNGDIICTELNDENIKGDAPIRQFIMKTDNSFEVKVGCHSIPFKRLQIDNKFQCDKISLMAIFTGFDKFKLCSGYNKLEESQRSQRCTIILYPASYTSQCSSCVNRRMYEEKNARKESASASQEEDGVLLASKDDMDLAVIMQHIHPELSADEGLGELIRSQQMARSCVNKRNHRWSPR